jgi:hypothetical protein
MKRIQIFLILIQSALLFGCQKDATVISTRELLVEKDWYMEKKVIQFDNNTISHNYLGLPTYSFRLTLNDLYSDSDGLKGTFRLDDLTNEVFLEIIPERRTAERYRIMHVGHDYLVVTFLFNGATQTLYFSTRL